MTIYGYGLDLNEQDRMEEWSFQRAWNAEKERIHATVHLSLREKLRGMYKFRPEGKTLYYSPDDFVDAIAWRIYTEWCMDETERGDPDKYQGEALLEFIKQETYYAGERLAKKGISISEKELNDKILQGLVARTAELFSEWYGSHPPENDKRNLRTSLEEYIGF